MLGNFPGTVEGFINALCISKGIALLIPMNLCVFVAGRSQSFEKAFLMNGVLLLIPAAVFRFGVHMLRLTTPMYFAADGNLLSATGTVLPFAAWLFLSALAIFAANHRWSKIQKHLLFR